MTADDQHRAQIPALSYVSGISSVPLLGETIGANFSRLAAANAEREALVDIAAGRRWTYAQLEADVDALARGLLAAGVAKGDRVGIWALNCAQWVHVQYASAKIGAILVNVNPSYREHELRYALQQSGLKLLVSMTGYRSTDCRAMVDGVRPECPNLTDVVYLSTPDWDELLAAGSTLAPDSLARRMETLSADDPINIQYTSGTTGFPKGATLSHHNILNNGYFVTETIGISNRDRICIPVPFYHCFGMVMGNLGATSHGAAIVIPAPAFDPKATLAAVQDEKCTALYGVPTMFIAEQGLADFSSYDLSSLRTGIMAGSPCPVEVMKRCISEMNMSQVAIAYGMTETSPVSTQTQPDDDLQRRTATVGRVHPHLEVKIVDPITGLTVPRETTGEFCTRGYSVMLGYWNDSAKTSEAIDEARWMHTGDLAQMRDDGYITIVGRIKDMVIRGGENLYPREIEEFLYTHPDIADVQVVGVPDSKYGEELCAWIQLREGAATLDAAAVAVFCAGKLSRNKIPRYVLVVPEFPMTVTGKVRKIQMRDTSAELLGLV
ncbi:AMP-binding protein [Arthrobacter sp. H14-L1]|uniref:AMP-binding protein n=1 Tax=Arthrobacter sp. H14-L1 TaxID=2996697 RepID=UPI0022712E63|nr:AMP-binding protein [Arthrobacter sp. H14-L1]MCY0903868.1 AMP-binding protein [Arthrobacter sp. H14-L1]